MPFTSTLQSFRLSRCIYITGSCNPSTFSSLKRIMAYTWARLWARLLARLRLLSTSIHLILCCSCLFYHFNSGYLTASLNHPYWALSTRPWDRDLCLTLEIRFGTAFRRFSLVKWLQV